MMKTFASTMLGATLVAATLGFAQPAAARSDVGVYVGPGGVSISVETYRRYCRDDYYRRNHWNRCARFYGGGAYYPNAYYHHDRGEHRGRYKHWDREHRRWYWDDRRW